MHSPASPPPAPPEAHMALQDFDACIADSQKALKMLRGSNDAEQRATYVAPHPTMIGSCVPDPQAVRSALLPCVSCRVVSCACACRAGATCRLGWPTWPWKNMRAPATRSSSRSRVWPSHSLTHALLLASPSAHEPSARVRCACVCACVLCACVLCAVCRTARGRAPGGGRWWARW